MIRAEDQRVADIAYRLATAGAARCSPTTPDLGLVWQHLTQFILPDRPAAIVQYRLDSGPGALAVVPDGPAARGGVLPGDVLLSIDNVPLPPEPGRQLAFDQTQARARADQIDTLLKSAAAMGHITLRLARDGVLVTATVAPTLACPSRVHLARSNQLNAFADGTHVFLTTRLLQAARTDDELAFIIAHEMAHNILGHAARLRAASASNGLLGERALTRRTEREADLLGVDLMIDAGYDASGAGQVLDVLDRGPELPFLAAHDSIAARKAAIATHAEARRH